MKTFTSIITASADSRRRNVGLWRYEKFGPWARDCGLFEFVTGRHDDLVDSLGWGTAGSYVLIG